MKVLHVFKTYYPDSFGGIELFIKELSIGLKEKGIESSVFCLTSQKEEHEAIIDGIKVYKTPYDINISSTPFSIKAIKIFKEIIKDFDVLHYQFPYPFADFLHLMFGRCKKSIVTYQSDIVNQRFIYPFYKPLETEFLKNVDHIIATSPNYLKTSCVLKRFKDKTSVIPIGIDQDNYPNPIMGNAEKYKEIFDEKFFLFIGVLRYYKGLHTLIEAAKLNNFSVVIAGSGPLEIELQKQAEGYSNIHFIGDISEQEKVDLLTSCFAFVFPSHLRSEAFGISLLEALMFQKPLISCDIGTGTSFINKHNETGYIVNPNDAQGFSNAMKTLFSLDEKSIQKMRENAMNHYLDHFTKEKMIDGYIEVYKNL